MNIKFLMSLIVLFSFVPTYGDDTDGHDQGNAGDIYTKEFVEMGRELVQNLLKNPIYEIDVKALYEAVENSLVSSKEELSLNGQSVDAINYPERSPAEIVVSRKGWDRIKDHPHKKAFLVLHEYLFIMGVDDTNFKVSQKLDRADLCGRTEQIRMAIEWELKKSCYRVIKDDLYYVTSIYWNGKRKNNPLTFLDPNDLRGLPNVEVLSFPENKIERLEADTFKLVPNIESLGLDNNPISSYHPEVFHSLNNLQTVDLSYVGSEMLPKDLFKNSPLNYFRFVGDETSFWKENGLFNYFNLEVDGSVQFLNSKYQSIEIPEDTIKVLKEKGFECWNNNNCIYNAL